jgi:hypothetical protein
LIEWIESNYPFLKRHPWVAGAVVVAVAVALLIAWLVTAWRLGKWYYGRVIDALETENAWLHKRVDYLERSLPVRPKGNKAKPTAKSRRRKGRE